MILDEQLTAMIPPPDLWGSTGYTANNNKVGFKYAICISLFYYYHFDYYYYYHQGWGGAGGGMEQSMLC